MLRRLLLDTHKVWPEPALRWALKRALKGLNVALCLHRVSYPDVGPKLNDSNIDGAELDRLLDMLAEGIEQDESASVVVTFDDGYADAIDYVRKRYARFPRLEWLLFLRPEKTRDRAGFRWDLEPGSKDSHPASGAYDIVGENQRAELRALGDDPRYRLATIEDCKDVARLPKVRLGNHTNCHFTLVGLDPKAAQDEIRRSASEFEQLFGATEQFAFPFGSYVPEHVGFARSAGYSEIWAIEARPFRSSERSQGGALPRFPVFGHWPASRIALFIASACLQYKARALLP
ncbi:MAG: polysaccharide deacetylase family protein [Polyangiaceae bacterium]